MGAPDSQVFLFGANSLLGWSILRAGGLSNVTPFCNGFTRTPPPGVTRGICLDDEVGVHQLFARERPRLIVHCAGICNVGKCEEAPEFAHSVNVEGARILVDHAPDDARIVYCSTDHVFSGDGGPYREDTPPDPVSHYGRTRVEAERLMLARPNTLVVRTGLWIGPSADGRTGYLDWLRHRHRRGLPMTVIADEARSAVWAEDGARRVGALARSGLTGIRHIAATRAVSRPELAAYLDRVFDIGVRFDVQRRRELPLPHIGEVELATRFDDALASPLPAVGDLVDGRDILVRGDDASADRPGTGSDVAGAPLRHRMLRRGARGP